MTTEYINGNGNHAGSQAAPQHVTEYLSELLQGKRPQVNPPDDLCKQARGCFEDDGVGRVREFLSLAINNPDHADMRGAIEAALNPAPKLVYSISDILDLRVKPPALQSPDGKVILPGEGLVLLAGQTRSFKSFIALRWAMQLVALDKQVAYYLAEGFGGFSERIKAYQKHYGLPGKAESHLHFVDVSRALQGGLSIVADADAFIAAHEPLASADVAIVDTFRAVGQVVNENDNAEVGAALTGFRPLAGLVVLIHHQRKDSRTYAGAGAFDTNSDSSLEVEADGGLATLSVHGHRDNAGGFKVGYQMQSVDLGYVDYNGDTVSSLVAVEADLQAIESHAKADKQAKTDAPYIEALKAAPGCCLSRKDLLDAVGNVSDSTVGRWISGAEKRGLVSKAGNGKAMVVQFNDCPT